MSGAPEPLVVDIVIPARNAAETLRDVIRGVSPRERRSVVVVDYGSTDQTAHVARDAGAVVLRVRRGFGAACKRAVNHLAALPKPSDVVVFLAADGSDDPAEIGSLVGPIQRDDAELVIGKRDGAASRLGQAVALRLIAAIYRHRFEDLGPFRAIRLPALVALGMSDSGSGYNAEMQVKAVRLGLSIIEIPVSWRCPDGSGQERLGSTSKLLFHIIRHATAR